MNSRIAQSAVFLAALILASTACVGEHPADARNPVPTPTVVPAVGSISTPAPTSGPVHTARSDSAPISTSLPAQISMRTFAPAPTVDPAVASVSTASPTFVPVQTSTPTLTPVAVIVSAQTPAPISTPAPVPMQTATPKAEPEYLSQEILPCTPAPVSSVHPCEPTPDWAPTAGAGGSIIFDAPLHVDYLLNSSPTTPIYTTHVVLRGTYIPGTVRCTSGHRIQFPSFVDEGFGGLLIHCFADMRVNAYLLGSGPPC